MRLNSIHHMAGALVLASIVISAALTACAVVEQPPNDQFKVGQTRAAIVVSANKDEYAPGEPITITVATVPFYDGKVITTWDAANNVLSKYNIKVFNAQGQLASLTEEGLRLRAAVNSRIRRQIGSDTVVRDDFRLDTIFDLDAAGTYTVILLQTVGVADASEDLVSNPVEFTRLP